MRQYWTIIYIHVICIVILLVTGCSPYNKPTHLKLAALPEEGVCRIAVLPFINETGFPDGSVIVYRVFMTELNRLGEFQLAPEGDVRDAYRKVRLTVGKQAPDFNQLRIIGNYLNVPLLLSAHIYEMGDAPVVHKNAKPILAINFKLFDVQKGRTIWSTFHTRMGEDYRKVMHFGLVNTVTLLAGRMSEQILTLWESEGFIEKCTESTD